MRTVVRDAEPERDFASIAGLLTRHGTERVESGSFAETSVANDAMRALNRSLGYVEQPGYVTLSKHLRSS